MNTHQKNGMTTERLTSGCFFFFPVTFAHADGAALPVLSVALAAVLVAGEGGALDASAHLAAVFVPPAERQTHTHCDEKSVLNSQSSRKSWKLCDEEPSVEQHGVVIQRPRCSGLA